MDAKRELIEKMRSKLGCSNHYSGTMAVIGQIFRDGDGTAEDLELFAEDIISLVDEAMVMKAYAKLQNR